MIEFLASDSFLTSFFSVVIALVTYLVTYLLCHFYGITKDSLNRTFKRFNDIDRNLALFLSLSKKKNFKREKARRLLLKIRLTIKDSSSSLQVMLYESEDNPDLRSVIKRLNQMLQSCDNVALYFNEGKTEAQIKEIEKMRKTLKDALTILKKVKSKKDEDKKKVI